MGLGLSGLRLGLGQQLWGTVWSPANLFPTGTEEGLFLDFSDISTLYTDQTFSTNISAIGDPVGGVIDKSQGGGLGPELGFVFDISAVWSDNGDGSYTNNGSTGNLEGVPNLTIGSLTEVTFTVSGRLAGKVELRVGSPGSTGEYQAAENGTHTVRAIATGSVLAFRAIDGLSAGATVSAISVRELPGNHLKQATAAARPIWTRHPKSGVRNLIDQNELLNGPKWGTPSAGAVTRTDLGNTGPNGMQAWRLEGNNTNSWLSNILPGDASAVPGTRTQSVWVRFVGAARPSASMTLFFYNPGGSPNENLRIDTLMTEEWQRITHTSSTAWSAPNLHIGINVANGAADGHVVEVAGFQAEFDATATTYQTRVSKYNVTEAGVDDCYGLTFDGVDDYMAPAAAFTLGGTKLTVAAGVFKAQESSTSAVLGVGVLGATGDWMLTAPGSSGAKDYYFGYKSVATSYTADTGTGSYDAPTTDVIVGYTDASDIGVLRVNGSQAGAAPAAFDGSFGGTPYLGASNNSGSAAVRFTGTIYGVTLTDYTLDAEQLAALETWTAARTPEVTLA